MTKPWYGQKASGTHLHKIFTNLTWVKPEEEVLAFTQRKMQDPREDEISGPAWILIINREGRKKYNRYGFFSPFSVYKQDPRWSAYLIFPWVLYLALCKCKNLLLGIYPRKVGE